MNDEIKQRLCALAVKIRATCLPAGRFMQFAQIRVIKLNQGKSLIAGFKTKREVKGENNYSFDLLSRLLKKIHNSLFDLSILIYPLVTKPFGNDEPYIRVIVFFYP